MLTGSRDTADDLVQASLLRALDRLGQWQEGTRMDSWMFRICQNQWIDWLRGPEGRAASHVDIDEAVHLSDGQEDRSSQRIDLQRVLAAIERLPAEQRAVLALVCVEEHSYREAAELLDVPIGTVMSRLARGRLKLNELLGQAGSGRKT